MKPNKHKVKRLMRKIAHEHIDDCGDVNCTALVEDAADRLNFNHVGGPLDDSDHDVWTWALEVAEVVQAR